MWLILKNTLSRLEKNLHSDFFGSNVLKISSKFNYSVVSFSISVILLIYCLVDLSTDVSEVLILLLLFFVVVVKSPLYICLHLFYIFECSYIGVCLLMNIISSHCIDPLYHYTMSFLSFVIAFVVKSILSNMSIRIPAILSFLFV